MRERKHVWVDGSLRDGEWYCKVFQRIAEEHPAYQIAIFHVTAEEEEVKRRAAARAEVTGRVVPLEEILDSVRRVPQTVDLLTPLSSFVATIDNTAGEPRFAKWVDTVNQTEATAPAGGECLWMELERRLKFKGTFFENVRARMASMSMRSPSMIVARGGGGGGGGSMGEARKAAPKAAAKLSGRPSEPRLHRAITDAHLTSNKHKNAKKAVGVPVKAGGGGGGGGGGGVPAPRSATNAAAAAAAPDPAVDMDEVSLHRTKAKAMSFGGPSSPNPNAKPLRKSDVDFAMRMVG